MRHTDECHLVNIVQDVVFTRISFDQTYRTDKKTIRSPGIYSVRVLNSVTSGWVTV